MQIKIKKVELNVEKLTRSSKVRRVKEKWYLVKMGDREFLMPAKLIGYFTGKLDSHFYLYSDGNRVITDNPNHIPVGISKEDIKEYRFIIANKDVEFYKPEDYGLIAEDGTETLYIVNHDDDILYRTDKEYVVWHRINAIWVKKAVEFYVEKPLNEETIKLIKRMHDEKDKIKYVRYGPYSDIGFEIGIIDDVDVYVGENHYILALENAEIVKIIDRYNIERLVAIKGDKVYLEINGWNAEDEISFVKIDEENVEYVSRYRKFKYKFKALNIIKRKEFRKLRKEDRIIAEIPNLEDNITIRKFIIKVKPEILDFPGKKLLYSELLKPEMVEEKTYKLRDLVRKLNADKNEHNYKVNIALAVNA